jgi:hypothetical protein
MRAQFSAVGDESATRGRPVQSDPTPARAHEPRRRGTRTSLRSRWARHGRRSARAVRVPLARMQSSPPGSWGCPLRTTGARQDNSGARYASRQIRYCAEGGAGYRNSRNPIAPYRLAELLLAGGSRTRHGVISGATARPERAPKAPVPGARPFMRERNPRAVAIRPATRQPTRLIVTSLSFRPAGCAGPLQGATARKVRSER